MVTINSDIEVICSEITVHLQVIIEAWEARGETEPGEVSPAVLGEALEKYMDVLRRGEADDKVGTVISAADVTELGDYGISLIGDVIDWADTLVLMDAGQGLRELIPALALWIAGNGGELRSLEPLVDALAQTANREQDTAKLLALSIAMTDILMAVAPNIRADLDKFSSGRPWRVLLLNYCIVATRSHDIEAIHSAYDTLTEFLPEDAADFFREGMQQMDVIGYPDSVRVVVEKYYKEWCDQTLH